MIQVRDAVPDDWHLIWPIARVIMAEGETYCWPTESPQDAARSWWMGKPGGRVFVAEADGVVVGTAEMHPNQPAAGSHVANSGFMVAPGAAGRGVGRALATHVLTSAVRDGYRAMQFNAVVETNRSAVRLWESLGFRVIATVPEAFAHPVHGLVGLHIMHRPLTAD